MSVKKYIRYNNNRNIIFVIYCFNNYVKIITYRKAINNCLKINSVKYFPIGSIINFTGNNPYIDNPKITTKYSAQLWNSQNVYNEWILYQKGILNN